MTSCVASLTYEMADQAKESNKKHCNSKEHRVAARARSRTTQPLLGCSHTFNSQGQDQGKCTPEQYFSFPEYDTYYEERKEDANHIVQMEEFDELFLAGVRVVTR